MIFDIRRNLVSKLQDSVKPNGHSKDYVKGRTEALAEIIKELDHFLVGIERWTQEEAHARLNSKD